MLQSSNRDSRTTDRRKPSFTAVALLTLPLFGLPPAQPFAQDSGIGSDFSEPKRHFSVGRPADLSGQDALAVYDRIREDMASVYAMSSENGTRDYQGWRRYNSVPYRSATHGERYVNNYANGIARDYGLYEGGFGLPAGSVLAKDSFAVTARGDVFTGPLFIMEKMPQGTSPQTADWHYSMVMPDGSVFGRTSGAGAQRVAFCHACHKAAAADDHLFFVPKDNRVRSQASPGDD